MNENTQKKSKNNSTSTEINLLKNLSNIGGEEKLNKFILSHKNKFLIVKYITIITICIFIIFYFFAKEYLKCISSYIVMITIVNSLARRLYIHSLEKIVSLFKTFCINVVKFEDYIKCILKINGVANAKNFEISSNPELSFLEEILIKIILKFNQINKLKIKLNSEDKWKDYMKNKYELFTNIFSFFEENFQNKKYFIFFLIFDSIKVYFYLHKLEKINLVISHSLNNLKNKIENDSEENEKVVIDKILKNTISYELNSTPIFMDQISDLLVSNKKISQDYIELFNLLHTHKDNKEKILEKFELLLESKHNTINILKQIKSNYISQSFLSTNPHKDNHEKSLDEMCDKKNEPIQSGVSLFDIELTDKPKQIETEKKILPTVSHFDIMRGAENTRQLQMNLIYDLEEFQYYRNKEEEEGEVNNNNINSHSQGIVLENIFPLD
jgi:hypothetical protein